MADLIITNGDSAADLLQRAGRAEPILPWRDVLHEGPLVAGPLPACSEARVAYLARRFRMPAAEIAAEFAARDGVMAAHANSPRSNSGSSTISTTSSSSSRSSPSSRRSGGPTGWPWSRPTIFSAPSAPTPSSGSPNTRGPLTEADLALAASLWADLTAPTPEAIAGRVEKLDDRLPYAAPALRRFLEELPAPANGLGRTEQAILDGIAGGATAPGRLFHAVLAREEAAFMGDLSFFRLLDDLASCDVPLIAGLAPPRRRRGRRGALRRRRTGAHHGRRGRARRRGRPRRAVRPRPLVGGHPA